MQQRRVSKRDAEPFLGDLLMIQATGEVVAGSICGCGYHSSASPIARHPPPYDV